MSARPRTVWGAAATVAVAALLAPCGPALASPTETMVRIEGRTRTLFEGPILTEGHAVSSYKADGGNAAEDLAEHPCDGINVEDPWNTLPGPTSTAASVDAMNLIGETQAMAGQWYPGYNDYFVKQWGSEAENAESEGRAWGILVNNVFTNVGGCQYELSTGDEVLWVYNAFEFRPFLALFAAGTDYSRGERPLTATAQLGEPFEVEVLAYEDDQEDVPPAEPERTGAVPFAGAEVAPVLTSEKGFETVELESPQTVTTSSEGKASITFTEPGWHRIMAGAPLLPLSKQEEEEKAIPEEEAIRSNRLDVCVPAPGETGCGAPPPEDQVRVPPRYEGAPSKEGKEEPPASNPQPPASNEQPPTTGSTTTNTRSTSSAAGASQEAHSTSPTNTNRPAAVVTVTSSSPTRLVVRISTAGSVQVKIAKRVRAGRKTRWHATKTLAVRTGHAGTLTIELPHLRRGSYRLTITLDGGKPLTKTLVIH